MARGEKLRRFHERLGKLKGKAASVATFKQGGKDASGHAISGKPGGGKKLSGFMTDGWNPRPYPGPSGAPAPGDLEALKPMGFDVTNHVGRGGASK
jgi:hypothetical protein